MAPQNNPTNIDIPAAEISFELLIDKVCPDSDASASSCSGSCYLEVPHCHCMLRLGDGESTRRESLTISLS